MTLKGWWRRLTGKAEPTIRTAEKPAVINPDFQRRQKEAHDRWADLERQAIQRLTEAGTERGNDLAMELHRGQQRRYREVTRTRRVVPGTGYCLRTGEQFDDTPPKTT